MSPEIPKPLQIEHEELPAQTEEWVLYPAAVLAGEVIARTMRHLAEA